MNNSQTGLTALLWDLALILHGVMTEWSKVCDSSESFLEFHQVSHQRKLAGVRIPFTS